MYINKYACTCIIVISTYPIHHPYNHIYTYTRVYIQWETEFLADEQKKNGSENLVLGTWCDCSYPDLDDQRSKGVNVTTITMEGTIRGWTKGYICIYKTKIKIKKRKKKGRSRKGRRKGDQEREKEGEKGKGKNTFFNLLVSSI